MFFDYRPAFTCRKSCYTTRRYCCILAANQLPTASALAAASITAQLQAQDSLDTISAGTLSALNAQNVFSQVASNPLTGYGFNSPGIASTASSVMGIPMPNSYTSSVAPTPITTTT